MSTPDRDVARILIVDDRPENLVALEAILEPVGHELVRANSGAEALKQVLLHDFAVILLDVQMPGMNGFETAHLIKARERSKHIPIIFLTAINKEEEYIFQGYSAGAVDYLFKPFNPDILRSKVAVFVDLYLKGAQLRRQSEQLLEGERREIELRHRAALLESEARFAEIVVSATEAIITFGDDRLINLFNVAAEEMFRFPGDSALGRSVDELFASPIPEELLRPATSESAPGETRRSGESATHELVGVRWNGETFPIELSVSRLQLEKEVVYTLVARDISERRRVEEELRSQATSLASTTEELRVLNEELNDRQMELERAMTARSRFYASMSHELRTPINAILGYTQLLMEGIYGPLSDQQAKSIDRTFKAGHHLLDLVNDILDLSKIEAGKIELQLEPVVFPAIIQDLFVTVAPLAQQSEVPLELIADDGPFTLVTDPRRVRQILLNLLSNAIKFGGGKPVVVRLRRLDDEAVEVDVTDQGPGIPEVDLNRIFDEFVQLAETHRAQGTGLGLSISRRLAEVLGGTLTVRSNPGEGSTFTARLASLRSPFPAETDRHPAESSAA